MSGGADRGSEGRQRRSTQVGPLAWLQSRLQPGRQQAMSRSDYVKIDFRAATRQGINPFRPTSWPQLDVNVGTFWGLLVLSLAYVHHSTAGSVPTQFQGAHCQLMQFLQHLQGLQPSCPECGDYRALSCCVSVAAFSSIAWPASSTAAEWRVIAPLQICPSSASALDHTRPESERPRGRPADCRLHSELPLPWLLPLCPARHAARPLQCLVSSAPELKRWMLSSGPGPRWGGEGMLCRCRCCTRLLWCRQASWQTAQTGRACWPAAWPCGACSQWQPPR